MKILAIETSCDETAVAILEINGSKRDPQFRVLSHIVSSQVKIHTKFGGVVPNLARREHERNLPLILKRTLRESGLLRISKQIPNSKFQTVEKILERESDISTWFKREGIKIEAPDIDAIAVTYGPGLAPALWVGVNFAKALSCLWNKPLIPVNHMAGHFYSALIETKKRGLKMKTEYKKIAFPVLALLVSGAHTELVLIKKHGDFRIIGSTLDDAAGEAFDKVARMLGFGYPGGPAISAAAEMEFSPPKADPIKFPRPVINSKNYDFSFSGLKTAVLYFIRSIEKTHSIKKLCPAIAREFQNAVTDVLVTKTIRAAKECKVKTVTLGGGVAANAALRERLAAELAGQLPKVSFITPELSLTGDNGLMIALAAYFCGKKKAWTAVQADANLNLT
ncbi:MAG: tRNA (adenosine(37)-N6)-threonylcarbamoyltransferase complex transferase subunit TsaD [Candidatus Sungbacteria bacterium]|nr:tRNA (adenosine(37)-N6)-threonylcarbamoyltransferase complex transferase subunit TsaD [Candidatus Sungbacteria bacterium]